MRAAKGSLSHYVDFSAENLTVDGSAALRAQIVRFVRGIRGDRKVPLARSHITNWFSGTPKSFVLSRLDEVVAEGKLTSVKKSNGTTVFFDPDTICWKKAIKD